MAGGESDRTLGEVGEFEVIDRLTRGRPASGDVIVGPGDDAAVVSAGDGRVVVSTDMLVEGRHFRLDWSTPHDIGRKAVAQNAADIEAMGARVTSFVVGFGAPARNPDRAGQRAGRRHVGRGRPDRRGDRRGRPGQPVPQWVVSVTVLGDLGRPGAGAEVRRAARLADRRHRTIRLFCCRIRVVAQRYRSLRRISAASPGAATALRQGRAAAEAGAQAMIDMSDGLVGDLRHVADASRVSLDLSTDALSADLEALQGAAQAVGADPWDWVLGGGEDHAPGRRVPRSHSAGLAGDRTGARRAAGGARRWCAVERLRGLAII